MAIAENGAAAGTVAAVSAVGAKREYDVITDFDIGDPRTDLFNYSRSFMAGHIADLCRPAYCTALTTEYCTADSV